MMKLSKSICNTAPVLYVNLHRTIKPKTSQNVSKVIEGENNRFQSFHFNLTEVTAFLLVVGLKDEEAAHS